MTSAKQFETVFLHFGLDKTGSSAIQDVCDRARGELRSRHGMVYPPGVWHAQLGSCFSKRPARYVWNLETGSTDEAAIRQSDERYLAEQTRWIQSQPGARALLFSYEGFIGLSAAELADMRAHCETFADDVRVLLYVRPPLSYAVSAMSQRVKMGRPAWDEANPPAYDFQGRFSRLVQAFGREAVTVRPFTRAALTEGDVVIDFFHALGMEIEPARALAGTQRASNESISDRARVFGEALRSEIDKLGLNLTPADFNNMFGAELTRISGSSLALTSDQITRVLTDFEPHALALRQECGIEFNESAERYQKDAPLDDASNQFATDLASLYLEARLGPVRIQFAQGHLTSVSKPAEGSGEGLLVTPGEVFKVPVTLHHGSCHWWRGTTQYPLRMCYHWLHADRSVADFEGRRTPIPVQTIRPGQRVNMDVSVQAPQSPGKYVLQLVPLQEGYCWFEQKGFTPLEMAFQVLEPSLPSPGLTVSY